MERIQITPRPPCDQASALARRNTQPIPYSWNTFCLRFRKPLMVGAPGHTEPMGIFIHDELALSISLSAFSYPLAGASARLMARAGRVTGKGAGWRQRPFHRKRDEQNIIHRQ